MEALVLDQPILIFAYVLLITVVLYVKNDLVKMNEGFFFSIEKYLDRLV